MIARLTVSGLVTAICLLFLAMPFAAKAQPTRKTYRIGMLETTSAAHNAANLEAFRRGLRELGYVEGRDVVVEYRSADGRAERFPDLAAELVRLKVELILARGAQAILAAENATQTIPIVMMGGTDPVVTRLVGDIARPGRNVTGLNSFVIEIAGKRLQLLREAVPGIVRIAALLDMGGPAQAALWKETEVATRAMGLQPLLLDVRKAEHFERAFDSAIKQRADAILVGLGTLTMNNAGRIIDFSLRRRLPLLSASRELVDAGGLMSYGVNYPDLYRRGATYVDKILKGAKPADLPVEQPTKLDLVINMKTARVLGLTIPSSLLLRADQIID